MIEKTPCPRCGAPLPAEVPASHCPRCLLAAGLDTETVASPPPAPPRPEEIASLFPQLDILELLGHGGMGIVYKARQKRLDRIVALKILSPAAEHAPSFAERFAREARALARLSHPNIVTVFDFGESGGLYYLLMEYVDGTTLRHVLIHRHMTPKQTLALVPTICEALQYAHDQGVVHRDIKPENVLLGRDGTLKIADFGLAKLAGGPAPQDALTGTGQVMGTPQYMAPEQIETPGDVDHRADIYSLGVVFYEMLTGELPLGRFAPPSRKVQIDVRLDDIVLRTLEKERDRRYQRVIQVKERVTEIGDRQADPASAAFPNSSEPRSNHSPPVPPEQSPPQKQTIPEKQPPGPSLSHPPQEAPPRQAASHHPVEAQTSPPRRAESGLRPYSKLAIWGFICVAASLLLQLASFPAMIRGPVGVSAAGLLLLGSGPMLIGMIGMGLSLAGWIVVARSRGRLRGLGLAIVGTLSLPLCYILFPFVFLMLSRATFVF